MSECALALSSLRIAVPLVPVRWPDSNLTEGYGRNSGGTSVNFRVQCAYGLMGSTPHQSAMNWAMTAVVRSTEARFTRSLKP